MQSFEGELDGRGGQPWRLLLDAELGQQDGQAGNGPQPVEQLGGGRTRVSGVARDNDLVSEIDASGTPQSFSPAAQVAFTFETAGDIVVTARDEAGNETVFTP